MLMRMPGSYSRKFAIEQTRDSRRRTANTYVAGVDTRDGNERARGAAAPVHDVDLPARDLSNKPANTGEHLPSSDLP